MEGVQGRTRQSASTQLGERVRQLRVAAGQTQTDLAGNRFSKEYISQIERGKTRPTQDTIDWLAARLKTDAGYLEHGVETVQLARAEAMLSQAEALAASKRHDEAAEAFTSAQSVVAATGLSELEFRRVTGEAWSRLESGDVRRGVAMLVEAESLPAFASLVDIERAEHLYRIGVARAKLGSTHVAMGLLTEAHKLAEQSLAPDMLRVEILRWRAFCLQRLKDVDLAKADIELAIELGEHMNDPRALGDALFQASLIAEREGRYVLARRHAERARDKFIEADEPLQLAKILNNLGGVHFQLKNFDAALTHFKDAYKGFLDAGQDDLSAVAQVSVAQVHLAQGNPGEAVRHAEAAVARFSDNPEWLPEMGDSYYYLGQARLALHELGAADEALAAAADALTQAEERSGLARVVLAQGDVATARGDTEGAAQLYRKSAEMLQDIQF